MALPRPAMAIQGMGQGLQGINYANFWNFRAARHVPRGSLLSAPCLGLGRHGVHIISFGSGILGILDSSNCFVLLPRVRLPAPFIHRFPVCSCSTASLLDSKARGQSLSVSKQLACA